MLEKTQSIAQKGVIFLCVVAVICSAIFGVTTIAAVDKFNDFIETPSAQAAENISDVGYVVNDAIEEPQAKSLVDLKPVSSNGNNGSGSGGIVNVIFGNDTVQNDGIDSNNYNFNHNLWLEGMNADEAFDVFFSWLSCDPCLMAATATGIQSRIGDIGLQAKESGITGLEEKANASAFSYYNDRAYWQNDLNTLYYYLSEKPRKIDEIGDYNSAMYQSHNDSSILPRIVVRKTKNSNGHALAFQLAPGTEVRFRLECGFQMVDIIETYVPETTTTPETTATPEETTTTPEETTTTETTTTTVTTTVTETTTPETTTSTETTTEETTTSTTPTTTTEATTSTSESTTSTQTTSTATTTSTTETTTTSKATTTTESTTTSTSTTTTTEPTTTSKSTTTTTESTSTSTTTTTTTTEASTTSTTQTTTSTTEATTTSTTLAPKDPTVAPIVTEVSGVVDDDKVNTELVETRATIPPKTTTTTQATKTEGTTSTTTTEPSGPIVIVSLDAPRLMAAPEVATDDVGYDDKSDTDEDKATVSDDDKTFADDDDGSKVPEAQDNNGVPETANPEAPEISESAPANIDNVSVSDYSAPDVVIINPIVTEVLII